MSRVKSPAGSGHRYDRKTGIRGFSASHSALWDSVDRKNGGTDSILEPTVNVGPRAIVHLHRQITSVVRWKIN